MTKKVYSIFGAGAAGLYTAWRLLDGKSRTGSEAKQLTKGDTLELYDWGNYDFSKANPGTREPGARVCTWHYQNDKTKSYVELGGMRYSEWDSKAEGANDGKAGGHRVVTTVDFANSAFDKYSVPFNESTDPFVLPANEEYVSERLFLRAHRRLTMWSIMVRRRNPDQGFSIVESLAVTSTSGPQTRAEWDQFYQTGCITAELPETSVFQKGDLLKDIGYWNLMYDRLGSEGYSYSADGNGYTSNVINWNSRGGLRRLTTNSPPALSTRRSPPATRACSPPCSMPSRKLAKAKGEWSLSIVPRPASIPFSKKDGVIHYSYRDAREAVGESRLKAPH